jgi:2-polyprenyl-6-methoxyphenol hydroxylase-like FAD-dependent oxidoreductase
VNQIVEGSATTITDADGFHSVHRKISQPFGRQSLSRMLATQQTIQEDVDHFKPGLTILQYPTPHHTYALYPNHTFPLYAESAVDEVAQGADWRWHQTEYDVGPYSPQGGMNESFIEDDEKTWVGPCMYVLPIAAKSLPP